MGTKQCDGNYNFESTGKCSWVVFSHSILFWLQFALFHSGHSYIRLWIQCCLITTCARKVAIQQRAKNDDKPLAVWLISAPILFMSIFSYFYVYELNKLQWQHTSFFFFLFYIVHHFATRKCTIYNTLTVAYEGAL